MDIRGVPWKGRQTTVGYWEGLIENMDFQSFRRTSLFGTFGDEANVITVSLSVCRLSTDPKIHDFE